MKDVVRLRGLVFACMHTYVLFILTASQQFPCSVYSQLFLQKRMTCAKLQLPIQKELNDKAVDKNFTIPGSCPGIIDITSIL